MYTKEQFKNAFNMAWPAIIESFFVAFAGLVDSYMVSALGANAVAAVGLTTQPKFLGLSTFFAINVAVSALIARRRGEDRRDDANRILYSTVILVVILSVVFSIVFVTAASPIISACGSNSDTHDMAVTYFRIIMGGMIFNCVQMVINSAQRGAGNTKITMTTNLTSNTVNIIFNYFLIEGHFGFPALGIEGAAYATVLGTVVSSVMSVISVCKKACFVSFIYIIKEKIRPAMSSLKQIVVVGYSVFFEQILMRIGFMLTAIMAANQGTGPMAAHQVGMNIMSLTFSFGDGLQAAAVALIGRSLGEGDEIQAKRYGRICWIYGIFIAVLLAITYFFGARWMMGLFFNEPEIVDIGVSIMRVIIFVVVFQVLQVVYMGCLRGAGDTFYTALASTISVTIIRTLGSYICGIFWGLGIVGIWLGVLFDQISRFVFSSIRFRQGKWTKIKI